ncbi:L-lactate 2-monooxygenase [Moesziomyces antarcticus]|uniref:Related to CYB2 - lactate dehydrogenase cytochrome b2 n=2 Tax=Pseudozyma antarctica TaxID=84753 RepID=A0A5C3FTW9_PSEA2|nr:L-lactate 2-monooxygenase [Moesziomyces antarcticus]GAK66572.1 L-lactate 2-monooxygenase [Moesziomyces antarcticus]SPO47620.1 related to CYB2 - lactate dehydrogenase cytochrome b2 [Moesziomyces antarcticus]
MSDPKSGYLREIYVGGLSGVKPQTTDLKQLELHAKAKLKPEAYAYVAGSASTEATAQNNLDAFKKWHIVPSMLRDVSLAEFDTATRLFGRKYATPLVIAPIGVQAQLHPEEADCATACAAAELEIPFTLSSATSRPLEQVYEQAGFRTNPVEEDDGGVDAWFQLYWPQDDELTESLLARAKKAGYRVLVVTLDTWSLGWRPRDLDTTYNPFLTGEGVANVFSDPVFVRKYCDGKDPRRADVTPDEITSASVAAISQLSPGISRSWADLAQLRRLWGSAPIVLKGIQTLADAARAVEAGMDGVWVSNHGGRQVDGAVGSLTQLPAIADYIRSLPLKEGEEKKTVIFDSGIRSGADIMKALSLGADGVAIGRPWCWGLAANGQDGVRDVLKTLLADLELNAGLAGFQSTAQLSRHNLVRADSRM